MLDWLKAIFCLRRRKGGVGSQPEPNSTNETPAAQAQPNEDTQVPNEEKRVSPQKRKRLDQDITFVRRGTPDAANSSDSWKSSEDSDNETPLEISSAEDWNRPNPDWIARSDR